MRRIRAQVFTLAIFQEWGVGHVHVETFADYLRLHYSTRQQSKALRSPATIQQILSE